MTKMVQIFSHYMYIEKMIYFDIFYLTRRKKNISQNSHDLNLIIIMSILGFYFLWVKSNLLR